MIRQDPLRLLAPILAMALVGGSCRVLGCGENSPGGLFPCEKGRYEDAIEEVEPNESQSSATSLGIVGDSDSVQFVGRCDGFEDDFFSAVVSTNQAVTVTFHHDTVDEDIDLFVYSSSMSLSFVGPPNDTSISLTGMTIDPAVWIHVVCSNSGIESFVYDGRIKSAND